MQKKRKKLIGLAACICVVAFGLGMAWNAFGELPFDSTLWKNSESDAILDLSNDRLKMAENLVRRRTLVLKTRSDVQKLLGEIPVNRPNQFEGYDCAYYLGVHERLLDVEPAWLCIKFQDDVVLETRIVFGL